MTSSFGGCCFHTRRGLGDRVGTGWGAGWRPRPSQASNSEGPRNTAAGTRGQDRNAPFSHFAGVAAGAAVWPVTMEEDKPSSMTGPVTSDSPTP